MKQYFVYILTNKRNGTFYTGVTNDLIRRIYEHKKKLAGGFTAKHNLDILVYYEIHNSIEEAIKKEKLVKKWRRSIKREVIEAMKPDWKDFYFDICK